MLRLRGYLKGSKFPLTEIAGTQIPRIILGTHPFDGTTYTSEARDQQFRAQWTGPQSMVDVLQPIVQRFGVTASRGFPSDAQLSRWHQEALRLTMEALDQEIAIGRRDISREIGARNRGRGGRSPLLGL